MADSNITKRALAVALKELMAEMPFEKITVAHICERCDMHRKSFYYHFKDKYDLVNWIFDTEVAAVVQAENVSPDYDEHWAFIERCFEYLYENRNFYRKALEIKGQNSFFDHFREYIRPLFRNRLEVLMRGDKFDDFTIDIFTDTMLCTIERWLLNKDCMPAKQVVAKIRCFIQDSAATICQEIEN